MGVVALLRHFFCVRLTPANQPSGCVSLCVVDATADEGINMEINHELECFRRQWVYVDVAEFSPLLLTPRAPAVPSSGLGHERLNDPRLTHV